jgi:adenosylcobinamide kinase/adenosylcobinamide-phosphate guanylyltransferase
MGKLTLVLGGARSGKSAFAQRMAAERGAGGVVYVATAEAGDEEMVLRIEKHRQTRPPAWRTLEAPQDVANCILAHAAGAPAVLLDCVTMLVSNLLLKAEDPLADGVEAEIMAEIEALIGCVPQLVGDLILVSNEVGMALVPPYPLGRAFRDIVGRANQALAREADEVYLLVAGIPMTLKGG